MPRALALAALAVAAGCLQPPHKPPRDAGVPCDPFDPTDCGEAEVCQYASATRFSCQPEGPAGDHEACSPATPCRKGFLCAQPPSSDRALCLGLCHDDAQCPQDGGLEMCLLSMYSGGPAALCQRMQPCEPLASPVSCDLGEKCSLMRIPGPFVCVSPGSRGDYEACDHESECRYGFACVRYGGDPARCVGFCGVDADCPQSAGLELCLRRNQLDRPPILCERAQRCTPGAAPCDPGQSCYPYAGTSASLGAIDGICRATGTRLEASACDAIGDCADGLACLAPYPGAPSTCRPICAMDGTLPCPDGRSCVRVSARFGGCN